MPEHSQVGSIPFSHTNTPFQGSFPAGTGCRNQEGCDQRDPAWPPAPPRTATASAGKPSGSRWLPKMSSLLHPMEKQFKRHPSSSISCSLPRRRGGRGGGMEGARIDGTSRNKRGRKWGDERKVTKMLSCRNDISAPRPQKYGMVYWDIWRRLKAE